MLGFNLRKGLSFEAAGAPAGGAVADAAAPSASAAPSAAPGAPGAAQPDAFDWGKVGLASDAQALVSERQWKHPNDVISSYRNLEKLTGVPADQLLKLPKGDDPKAWNDIYTRLGRPEKAADYKLPVPEGDTSGFAKVAADWMHEAGLTQAGATRLASKWNEFQAGQMKAQQEQLTARDTQDVAALKAEWGGDYDKHAAIVDKAAEAFGMKPDQLAALKQVMGPKGAMEFMRNIGSKIASEDTNFVNGTAPSSFNGLSPDQAGAEMQRLQKDKSFAQEFSSADPRVRSEARSKMARLAQIAAPGMQSFPGRS